MVKNLEGYILDTSALISLECINILKDILELFSIITTDSVIKELEEFSKYDDRYGRIAKNILKNKEKFVIESCEIKEPIKYIEETDNELYNLAIKKGLPLVTDETKLVHHSRSRIRVYFTTFFLIVLASAGYLTKKQALGKLEELRDIRNWRTNIIYITTKKELEMIN